MSSRGRKRAASRGRKSNKTAKAQRDRSPLLTPPTAIQQQEFSLSKETILDGLYERMKRDGLLPTPSTSATQPHNTPSSSSTLLANADTDTIDDSIAQIMSHQGEAQGHTTPDPNLSQPFAPLSAHLPLKIQQKIWANEYVDMARLLPDYQEEDQKDKKVKKLSIAEFNSAFQIYISTLAIKQPEATPGLLKHLAITQKMARTYGPDAWREYDTRFRQIKQFDQTIQWGHVNIELYIETSLAGIKQMSLTQQPKLPPKPYQPFPLHTCWQFQKHGSCSRPDCRYPDTHKCYTCHGSHPTTSCTKNSRPHKPFRPKKPHSNPTKN